MQAKKQQKKAQQKPREEESLWKVPDNEKFPTFFIIYQLLVLVTNSFPPGKVCKIRQ